MDKRCPLGIVGHINIPCPMAIQRIKAIKYNSKKIKNDNMPGCPFYVMHQLSNYCFFQYMEKYGNNKESCEEEISSYLLISIEDVKKIMSDIMIKLAENDFLKDYLKK
jgi:hypothetical protein